jgi:hypothetical protein
LRIDHHRNVESAQPATIFLRTPLMLQFDVNVSSSADPRQLTKCTPVSCREHWPRLSGSTLKFQLGPSWRCLPGWGLSQIRCSLSDSEALSAMLAIPFIRLLSCCGMTNALV